jgi:hypothetical protein
MFGITQRPRTIGGWSRYYHPTWVEHKVGLGHGAYVQGIFIGGNTGGKNELGFFDFKIEITTYSTIMLLAVVAPALCRYT